MVYPDGETLTYQYDSGGMVRAASGVKGSFSYSYVNRLEYDKFGKKAFVEDGNGVKTSYTFDPAMQRLSNQVAGPFLAPNKNNLGNFENLGYTYDNVGNVTAVANNIAVPPASSLGGPSSQTFNYDDLDRLTSASGSYSLARTRPTATPTRWLRQPAQHHGQEPDEHHRAGLRHAGHPGQDHLLAGLRLRGIAAARPVAHRHPDLHL